MKWEPSDVTVGGAVLVAGLILAATLVWLSPAVANRTYPLYAEFDRIDGIAEQAPVYLRGYEIGRVGDIVPHLSADGSLVFRVEMNVGWKLASGDSLHLPVGTRARLTPPSVIGSGVIVLERPAGEAPPLQPGDVIPGERGMGAVDQVQQQATELTLELSQTLGAARVLMDTLTRTVAETRHTVAVLNQGLPPVLDGLGAQIAAAEALTAELRASVGTLTPTMLASMDSVQRLLSDSRRLIHGVEAMLDRREPEMAAVLANLDTTSILLEHFVRTVSDRPWKLLTGVNPPEGLAPPPSPAIAAPATRETRPDTEP